MSLKVHEFKLKVFVVPESLGLTITRIQITAVKHSPGIKEKRGSIHVNIYDKIWRALYAPSFVEAGIVGTGISLEIMTVSVRQAAFLFLAFVLGEETVNVRGNVELGPGFEEKVVQFVNAALACHNNPGLSLSVVKDGKTIFAK